MKITDLTFEPVTEHYTSTSPEGAAQHLLLDTLSEYVVFVAAIERERNVDWGNFYVWCNAERALIRLDEHREHQATVRHVPGEPVQDVCFRDDDGSRFSVPYQQTVSPSQALAALRFWLPAQQRTPELLWT